VSRRAFAGVTVSGAVLAVSLVVCRVEPLLAQRASHADQAALVALVEAGRGAGPLLCELAARTVETQWGWGGWWEVRAPRDQALRAAMAAASARGGDPAAVPALARALGDADPCVRRLAAPLLGRLGHPSALMALRAALTEGSAATREAAALGLGFSEDAGVIPALIAGLQDQVAAVRAASAWALGMIEDGRAIGVLVRVLREDPDAEVRAAAAWALGSIEG
jgi:hypothetical protein